MIDTQAMLGTLIDRLNKQDERIDFLSRLEFAQTNVTLTSGSVVFAGAGGLLSQDNTNFFWDDTNNRLGIGTNTPTAKLDVTGGYFRARDNGTNVPPTSGKGVEIIATGNLGYIFAYNRDTTAYLTMTVDGNPVFLGPSASNIGIGTSSTTAQKITIDGGIRYRDATNTRYRSDSSISSGGRTDNVFDDTGSVYLPYQMNSSQASFVSPAGNHTTHLSGVGSGASTNIELGQSASSNRNAWIDFRGDDTYTDYGLRLIRNAGGANTTSQLSHRGTGALEIISVDAGAVAFYTSNTVRWLVNSSGDLLPSGAGTYNLGNATAYMNDVSYKTLTDRGCLAFISEWELTDGRKVNNLQALREMKPHPTEKTVYGEIKLDYASVPKHSYKKAEIAQEDIELDLIGSDGNKLKYKKGDKMGEDGVEMTSMFSIMLGAIREMADKIDALQAEIDKTKDKIK